MPGMRIPPSQRFIFWYENGQLKEYLSPPLSLVKITRVFRSSLAVSSAFMTRPIPASMLFTISAYVPSVPPSVDA